MVDTNHITQLKAYGEITTDGMIICPYCFNQDEDAWEYNLNDGDLTEISCPNCDVKHLAECSIRVTYTTKKIEVEDGR